MTYGIRLSNRAASYLRRLDRQTEDRILARIDEIARDPLGRYSKPLTNSGGQRSSRIGDLRIIFIINADDSMIEITSIAPRGRAYRNL